MALVITVAFANTGNYGLPLVSFAFGPQALAFASLYFVTTSILFQYRRRAARLPGPHGFQDRPCSAFPCAGGLRAVILAAAASTALMWLSLVAGAATIDLAANGSIPLMIVLLGLELSRGHVVAQHEAPWRECGPASDRRPLIGLMLAIPFGLQGEAYQAASPRPPCPPRSPIWCSPPSMGWILHLSPPWSSWGPSSVPHADHAAGLPRQLSRPASHFPKE